ncbi:DNA mismatch repair endonuclease MutL [Histidinibacterium lentulum]|uniref:DNA mismatch repair protein MutL n=1 Tax=Histidinibacterium lentulum TaxID=2480588 RepID=A0A3N2R5S6_9RHOB|nr:DNA mismatch repair endonuclease MutL [Histidinibacterium lentulum]ROU02842.1 DNA mismatch repair endonuclease MutL [Histidinibacterium lentulum]
MALANPNMDRPRPVIRQLDEGAINRIAAGEVVERPASAVKELVENAIDAGATRIEVTIAEGGKRLIRVVDDGCGMTAEDLPLALSRHATSKIDGTDLLAISTFGFRGEALPSLGAVGRLTIVSRVEGGEAAEIAVAGGRVSAVRPAALSCGTRVELRDLFHATPARLKFLRTDRAEAQAIAETIRRLALAEPFIGFTLVDATEEPARTVFRADARSGDLFDALHGRAAQVLGGPFAENAVPLDAVREDHHLSGFAALPTYSRGSAVQQYLFVNGRPVTDKLLIGALRGAYADTLPRDRHPAAVVFVDCDPKLVDVNVHPAKSQVRFRDPGLVRGLIVSGIRHALAGAGHRTSSTVASATLSAVHAEPVSGRVYQMDRAYPSPRPSFQAPPGFAETAAPSVRAEPVQAEERARGDHPLGSARAQLHGTYIVAQTGDGVVIVDQHAAHERLVYEKLKRQMAETGVAAQALLIPEIVELSGTDAELLLSHAEDLHRMGLAVEPFGGGAVAVRETPAILGPVDAAALVRDILDELSDLGDSGTLGARLDAILSRVACHGSVRAGRHMRAEEMDALLREMEATPLSGQCNHGRPTYVELKLADIERLFGRA